MLRSPAAAAAVTLRAALTRPQWCQQGEQVVPRGAFLNGIAQVVPEEQLPWNARDGDVADRLWDVTAALVRQWEDANGGPPQRKRV